MRIGVLLIRLPLVRTSCGYVCILAGACAFLLGDDFQGNGRGELKGNGWGQWGGRHGMYVRDVGGTSCLAGG